MLKLTNEIMLRTVAQITQSVYTDMVFTGSRRYAFGNKNFLTAPIDLESKSDMDVVFPLIGPPWQETMIINSNSSSGEVVTEEFRLNKSKFTDEDTKGYLFEAGRSISGYIGIYGITVNLIGITSGEVVLWRNATRFISENWDVCPSLKYDKAFRLKLFKELRKP